MFRRLGYFLFWLCSVLLGWFMGYINVPFVESKNNFFLGFGACLALGVWMLSIHWINGKRVSLTPASAMPSDEIQGSRSIQWPWLFLGLLSFGLLAWTIHQNETLKKVRLQNQQSIQQLMTCQDQASTEDQKQKIFLMLELIRHLDSTNNRLRDTQTVNSMVHRLVDLSTAFKAQKEWDPERKAYQDLSSLRGMLLLALLNTPMDSFSFRKIKTAVSFAYSDLRNADLGGKDLSGIDLSHSSLERANLQRARLDYAVLRNAALESANLNNASLVETNLMSTKLKWCKINGATMYHVRLDSADMSNATLHKSILKYATFIQTRMDHCIFDSADISNSSFWGSIARYVDFTHASLYDASFKGVQLEGANLQNAIVQKNWMELLLKDENTGSQEVAQKYQLVSDSLAVTDTVNPRFILKLK